jgi:hypothetical protein
MGEGDAMTGGLDPPELPTPPEPLPLAEAPKLATGGDKANGGGAAPKPGRWGGGVGGRTM